MPSSKTRPSGARISIRFEPATLEEAIFAAQGLTDDPEGQAEIAASLTGLPVEEAKAAALKSSTERPRAPIRPQIASRPRAARPVVVVERRAPRFPSR